MSPIDAAAKQSLYEREVEVPPDGTVVVYLEGSSYEFLGVTKLRILCPSPETELLIIESRLGKFIFAKWNGIGVRLQEQSNEFRVSSGN